MIVTCARLGNQRGPAVDKTALYMENEATHLAQEVVIAPQLCDVLREFSL